MALFEAAVRGCRPLQLDVTLPCDSRAAAMARRALDLWRHQLEPDVLDDLELLISELVANSVRHSCGVDPTRNIHLRASAGDERVRVEVVDPGAGFDHEPKEPDLMETGGRGLYLVEILADAWGIESEPSTCVWFEMARRYQTAS